MEAISIETPTEGRHHDKSVAASTYRLIAICICVLTALSFFFLPLPTFQWFSDYWEHASALRVLSENLVAPTNPHYATYDPDRQFIPLFVALGYLMHVTGMAVTTAIAIGAGLTTILFCIGVRMFARAYFRHAWAPTILMAVLLCAWGTPWVWTGFYELRAIFYNNYYPAAFVLSLTFITWAVVVRALNADAVRTSDWLTLPFLAALMFVSHQLGGLFALGGAALFLLFRPASSIRNRVTIFLLLAAGLVVTWWWPYFNPIALTYYGAGDKENGGAADFYNALKVMLLVGPAWFGIPVLFGMARKRIHLELVVGFAAVFGAYLFGGLIGHPVAHRFLSYAVIYLHLPIVWALLSTVPGRLTWPRMPELRNNRRSSSIWTVFIVCVALQIAFCAVDFVRPAYERVSGKSFGSYPSQNVLPELSQVTEKLPDNAVIFASFDPALAITALKGKVIARPRPQLMIADGAERSKDNGRFFSLGTPQAERRTLIRKYGATHILIRKENVSKQLTEELETLGEVVPHAGSLVLIRLDNARTQG